MLLAHSITAVTAIHPSITSAVFSRTGIKQAAKRPRAKIPLWLDNAPHRTHGVQEAHIHIKVLHVPCKAVFGSFLDTRMPGCTTVWHGSQKSECLLGTWNVGWQRNRRAAAL